MRQFEAVYTFDLRPFRGRLRRFNIFPGQFIAEIKITP
nr:MAG TPA: two-partite extracellular sensor domain protein [Crassvirales sp.]DAS01612.1 MAG TPA: two-partite extracellular sensor domain protein [Caudoviricetes sp.]